MSAQDDLGSLPDQNLEQIRVRNREFLERARSAATAWLEAYEAHLQEQVLQQAKQTQAALIADFEERLMRFEKDMQARRAKAGDLSDMVRERYLESLDRQEAGFRTFLEEMLQSTLKDIGRLAGLA